MVKTKYESVLKLGEELEIKNGDVQVEGDVLTIKGETKTPYEKNLLWDKIKEAGGESPSDIVADITVADDSIFHKHTVVSGETLGGIAKKYYGSASKYTVIFKANTDVLDNPDLIKVGQEFVIPNL